MTIPLCLRGNQGVYLHTMIDNEGGHTAFNHDRVQLVLPVHDHLSPSIIPTSKGCLITCTCCTTWLGHLNLVWKKYFVCMLAHICRLPAWVILTRREQTTLQRQRHNHLVPAVWVVKGF